MSHPSELCEPTTSTSGSTFASTVQANYGAGTAADRRLRQKYIGRPPLDVFYQSMHRINTLRPYALVGLTILFATVVLVLLSALYTMGACYSDLFFHEIMLASFLNVMGASTGSGTTKGFCGVVLSLNAFLQVIFKSCVFAVVVNKLTKVTPRLYFTPCCVINVRDGVPVLMMRILNAQGTLLELVRCQAQWVVPHVTQEGERYGALQDLNMTAFVRMRSPTTLSHKIDQSSPLYGCSLDGGLRGAIFVTVAFWDPENQREVRHSTRYSLPGDCRPFHQFADLTTKTATGAFAADVTRFGTTVPLLNNDVNNGGGRGGGNNESRGSKYAHHHTAPVLQPWYIPDWNLERNSERLRQGGKIVFLIGARFYRGRLVPRCDFSAFVEMVMCECGIEYDRYLLDLDSKAVYSRRFPAELRDKNIPFLNDGQGTWFSLSVACMRGALATRTGKEGEEELAVFGAENAEVPEYDHKTFSEAVMQHLTNATGTEKARLAADSVRTFLRKYENYFDRSTSHRYLGGASLNYLDCQFIPHLSCHAALWERVKRTDMLAGFPRLRQWHDELIRRESFRKTWPQGYAVEDAVGVVAEMAVQKARSMYNFEFPDLVDEDGRDRTGWREGWKKHPHATEATKRQYVSTDTPIRHLPSGDIGAFCL